MSWSFVVPWYDIELVHCCPEYDGCDIVHSFRFVDESGGNPPAGCEDSLLSEHGTFEFVLYFVKCHMVTD